MKCRHCNHEWLPRTKKPRACPACKRYREEAPNIGESNGQWKGHDVGYGAIHDYIKYHIPKPKKCDSCGEEKRLDLANKSQEYKRDFTDWEWLCRKCHMHKDGRAMRLRFTGKHTEESRKKMSDALKGKPKSEEWKAKMRGKKHSEETKEKMRESARKRYDYQVSPTAPAAPNKINQ